MPVLGKLSSDCHTVIWWMTVNYVCIRYRYDYCTRGDTLGGSGVWDTRQCQSRTWTHYVLNITLTYRNKLIYNAVHAHSETTHLHERLASIVSLIVHEDHRYNATITTPRITWMCQTLHTHHPHKLQVLCNIYTS